MDKLQWIEIQNFRGIKYCKLEDFADLNVFIGRNNTGKSTILESIYLNITSQDLDLVGNDPLLFIFRRRGASLGIPFPRRNLDIDDLLHYLGYIFHRENLEEPVKFISNLKEYGLRVIRDEIPDDLLKFVINYITKRTYPKVEIGELLFIVADNLQRPLIIAFEEIRGEVVRYNVRFILHRLFYVDKYLRRQKRKNVKNVILVDTHWLFHYKFEEPPIKTVLMSLERYSRINKDQLVEFLSEQLEYKISAVEPKLFDIYIITEDDRFIPFSLLGDGTKISLMYFYVLSLENSYILFEEPENHLHPKLMSRCVDLMLESSNKNQIFISTHSLEFLEMILEKAKARNASLNVYKLLELKDGELKYKLYTRDVAYASIKEIGRDLRL
jgi:ABC-type histidine transport system ATPase subunit